MRTIYSRPEVALGSNHKETIGGANNTLKKPWIAAPRAADLWINTMIYLLRTS